MIAYTEKEKLHVISSTYNAIRKVKRFTVWNHATIFETSEKPVYSTVLSSVERFYDLHERKPKFNFQRFYRP